MSVDELLNLILRSRLIDVDRLQRIVHKTPADASDSAPAFASWLVDEGHLTQFQVEKLLKGIWRGLVIAHYEIRGLLGKGGMGTVYLAHDRTEIRECALKVLPVDKRAKVRNIRRFRREMQVTQRLHHADIAVAYEAGVWKGVHYLAMEYVPGLTLYQIVRQSGPPPAYYAAKWIAEVAGALDYAHQAGVVHRDLKASNVIITPESRAKLLDLGLARWFDDDHNEEKVLGARRIVGSFDYIAPEQSNNSARADARCDIYGMGCLLYFALAGRPPFHAVVDTREKIRHHREVMPPSIGTFRPELQTGFVAVLQKMMEKDPSKRYQVAAQVRDELMTWVTRWERDGLVNQPSPASRPPLEIPASEESTVLQGADPDWSLEQESASPTYFVEEERSFWNRISKELTRFFRR